MLQSAAPTVAEGSRRGGAEAAAPPNPFDGAFMTTSDPRFSVDNGWIRLQIGNGFSSSSSSSSTSSSSTSSYTTGSNNATVNNGTISVFAALIPDMIGYNGTYLPFVLNSTSVDPDPPLLPAGTLTYLLWLSSVPSELVPRLLFRHRQVLHDAG